MFLMQRKVEGWLHLLAPKRFIPLYTMVSFSVIPYAEVIRRWQRQMRIINVGLGTAALVAVAGAATTAATLWSRARKA